MDEQTVIEEENLISEQAEAELPSDRVADLVELIVCGLVDVPSSVALDVTDTDDATLIEIHCDEQDTGKVIGRKGRAINAIRVLARALGQRLGISVRVEVLD